MQQANAAEWRLGWNGRCLLAAIVGPAADAEGKATNGPAEPGASADDELPADTNKIESLTPEQARKLAEEFPGVEVEFDPVGFGKQKNRGCLPLNGLKLVDADTAKALAAFEGQRLCHNGLTTFDADTAKALAGSTKWNGNPLSVVTIDSPDSVKVAAALATRKGPLNLRHLKKLSPKTLAALIEKRDVEIPLIETLELIQEPDGSPTEDFVIPERLDKRQR